MLNRLFLFSFFQLVLWGTPEWVLIRTVDGARVEGQTELSAFHFERDGRGFNISPGQILSVQNGSPASAFEASRISQDLAAIQAEDRAARDQAVEELTAIGLPVMTPLLKAYKDTDQHEPRPLYRLFERVIPSYADGPDRTLTWSASRTAMRSA